LVSAFYAVHRRSHVRQRILVANEDLSASAFKRFASMVKASHKGPNWKPILQQL
jgi:hypothetical protein